MTEAALLCERSGQSPNGAEWQKGTGEWALCSNCGTRVRVFMRRMDWRDRSDLYLANHLDPKPLGRELLLAQIRLAHASEQWRVTEEAFEAAKEEYHTAFAVALTERTRAKELGLKW